MGGITLFGYSTPSGFLHRRHPLLKLAALGILSGAVFKSSPVSAAAALAVLLALFPLCRVRLNRLVPAAGFLFFTSFLLFGSIFLSAKGVSGINDPQFRELVLERVGDLVRLSFALFSGILFAAVTTPGELRAAIALLLKPLPSRFSEAVLLLVTFVFTLLPLTFQVWHQTRQAQTIRSAGRIRNPAKRLILAVSPFMARLFLKTDRMSDAAALRCAPGPYCPPGIPLTAGDFVLITGTGLLLRILSA